MTVLEGGHYILSKANEIFMIGVDVGQFNVNQQKNLKQNMGNCERNEKV